MAKILNKLKRNEIGISREERRRKRPATQGPGEHLSLTDTGLADGDGQMRGQRRPSVAVVADPDKDTVVTEVMLVLQGQIKKLAGEGTPLSSRGPDATAGPEFRVRVDYPHGSRVTHVRWAGYPTKAKALVFSIEIPSSSTGLAVLRAGSTDEIRVTVLDPCTHTAIQDLRCYALSQRAA
mgnify:CR=1 FL=1